MLFDPQKADVPITMEYEEELISKAVSALSCFRKENITEPENARIELGEDGYYIEPEVPGNHGRRLKRAHICICIVFAGKSLNISLNLFLNNRYRKTFHL